MSCSGQVSTSRHHLKQQSGKQSGCMGQKTSPAQHALSILGLYSIQLKSAGSLNSVALTCAMAFDAACPCP